MSRHDRHNFVNQFWLKPFVSDPVTFWSHRGLDYGKFGTDTVAEANPRFGWHCLPVAITFLGNEVDYRGH